jgi:hypothetical protein
MQFQASAEIFAVRGFSDKARSAPIQNSQSFFARRVDTSDLLKIEGVSVVLICLSNHPKEFLGP